MKERDVTKLELPEVQTLVHKYASQSVIYVHRSNRLSYIHQYDEEFEELKKARRPGRPASTREDLLKRKIEALEDEYEKGFCEFLNLRYRHLSVC